MHGEYNDLLVVGTTAAIYFDEAINVDTAENEGDVDSDDVVFDNSTDDDNDYDGVHVEFGNMSTSGADSSVEVLDRASGNLVNSTTSTHPPNGNQHFTQISEDDDDIAVAWENRSSQERHVQTAKASLFDSIMLNLVDTNQTQKGVLQDKTEILTQSFSSGRSSRLVTTSHDAKEVPTWVTTNIETEVSDNTSAQQTAQKASTIHREGAELKTEAVGNATATAKTSEALHILNPATSDNSRRYSSVLLSERLPPQQLEPAEDFCTFCRQVKAYRVECV